MCAQLVVYPQRRPIFSTTQLGWLPVPYYTQQQQRQPQGKRFFSECYRDFAFFHHRQLRDFIYFDLLPAV